MVLQGGPVADRLETETATILPRELVTEPETAALPGRSL